MPCNSIAIAQASVEADKLTTLLITSLAKLDATTQQSVAAALVTFLRDGTNDQITLQAVLPTCIILSLGGVQIVIDKRGIKASQRYLSESTLQAILARLMPYITMFCADLLAELTKAQMIQDGYTIEAEDVTPDGVKVISWAKEVA